jgi:hypothetical protein
METGEKYIQFSPKTRKKKDTWEMYEQIRIIILKQIFKTDVGV